ncbi:MAG: FliH/SctL family protein [Oscillospiraceae bacterium]|nr:FliH/SctL family protein [Oscillospiraceae bacterium]
MSKVIKAGFARVLPQEEGKLIPITPEPEPEVLVSEPGAPDPRELLERELDRKRAEMQEAYDELLNTAQNEASMIIADSRKVANEVIQQAQEQSEAEAQRIREGAHDEGYKAGFSEGFQEGFEAAKNQLHDTLENGQKEADRIILEAYEHRDRLSHEFEPKIYRMSLDIARKILGYELNQNDKAFLAIVKEALSTLRNETRVALLVSKEDFAKVFDSKKSIAVPTSSGRITADIRVDPIAEPGDCMVEAENGSMDISIPAQLDQIAIALGQEPEDV